MRYTLSEKDNKIWTMEELLDIISITEMQVASEESLKEVWQATKEHVLIMFGHQATLVKKIREYQSKDAFSQLAADKLVRAVLPRDLEAAMSALESINEILNKVRGGEVLNLDNEVGSELNDVGIEYREDGNVHADKFTSGNWGAGKGKTNLDKPMTFAKTIEEFGYQNVAGNIAEAFVQAVERFNKAKLINCLDRHYSDLLRAINNKQEKVDTKVNKRIAVKQTRNLTAVRNVLVKFVYKQLMCILKAYKEPPKQESSNNSDSSEYSY